MRRQGTRIDMWHHVLTWLRSAPITDEVDRRNAPVMQLLLLFYGVLLPANWGWRIASGEAISGATAIIFAVDMLIAALALVSIALIRYGRFRPAIMLFLAPQLISLEITFFMVGVMPQLIDPAPTMLTLAISGLVLGRTALWLVWGLLMAAFATGFVTNVRLAAEAGIPASRALRDLPAVLISYTLITIILDRTINALRDSLSVSNARGRELQREMAERERAQTQLIHAQKMEASGRLASGIAHDFNNILGVILGFSTERHRLDDPAPDPRHDASALAEALEGVEVAARRGAAISRKLLSFSRSDVTHAVIFDAGQAMSELRPMLHQLLGSDVRLRLTLDEAPLPVLFDQSQFELMLLSIAANARDAMPEGGDLEVRVGHSTGPGASVEITLADSGHGMSAAVQRHIFEPFFTTKPAGSGTGLGLAVAYGLVVAGGGEIDVESAPGQGTTFRVRLPLAADAAAVAVLDHGAASVRVLLVDDDDDLRTLLADTLRQGGCDVLAAASGQEAERLAATQPAPQVLVCDHRMPDTDGATLLRRLRERLPDMPAILISTYASDRDSQPLGAHVERLPKPFEPDQLLQRVRAVARRNAPG